AASRLTHERAVPSPKGTTSPRTICSLTTAGEAPTAEAISWCDWATAGAADRPASTTAAAARRTQPRFQFPPAGRRQARAFHCSYDMGLLSKGRDDGMERCRDAPRRPGQIGRRLAIPDGQRWRHALRPVTRMARTVRESHVPCPLWAQR